MFAADTGRKYTYIKSIDKFGDAGLVTREVSRHCGWFRSERTENNDNVKDLMFARSQESGV